MENNRLVDQYISGFPEGTREKLQQLRSLIQETLPEAKEIISYSMPAYKSKRVVCYFAGYGKHIGFYPTHSGISAFESRLGDFKYSKGAIQFPLDRPLPEALIREILLYRFLECQ
ncbi:MAG: DUF1801 domain-containing protein [Marinilabiliales bacterium]|nr:DUF1801 domain-containing protein [Marinilabiliales bacterium]